MQRYVAPCLFPMTQASEHAQLKLQGSTICEPGGIELSKLFFCFFEHTEVDITFDRLQMPNGLHLFRAHSFDDDATHNVSVAFDEIREPLFSGLGLSGRLIQT